MTGMAVRESVTLAGRAERARVARAFVGAVLGPEIRAWRSLCCWRPSCLATVSGTVARALPARRLR